MGHLLTRALECPFGVVIREAALLIATLAMSECPAHHRDALIHMGLLDMLVRRMHSLETDSKKDVCFVV